MQLLIVGIAFFCACSIQAQVSVLNSGNWFKLAISESGIYKIDYESLADYGIDPATINPKHIQLYGNGGAMLPEDIEASRYDDLQENAIFVFGEEDEAFDPGDYILFYGQGTLRWNLPPEGEHFSHQVNYYSDTSYYYLTTDLGVGKRIQTQQQSSAPANFTTSISNDYYVHNVDLINLIKSGKVWYGEAFGGSSYFEFPLEIENLNTNQPINLEIDLAVKSATVSFFNIFVDGTEILSFDAPLLGPSSLIFAKSKRVNTTFNPASSSFNLKIEYNPPLDSSQAWLEYFQLNFERTLNLMANGQLIFRNIESAQPGTITEFILSNGNAQTNIWNITAPLEITSLDYNISGTDISFILETDSILEFIAFNNTEYLIPAFTGQVSNQNLHGLNPKKFIIISPAEFMDIAQELGDFHKNNEELDFLLVSPYMIYNEFSSGMKDITAIRDFIKYVYDKAEPGNEPQYLLLFGDASYDNKDIYGLGNNYIPSWQAKESLNRVSSILSDDFYGILDNQENLLLGIGRIPARSVDEAASLVNKIIHYSSNANCLGNWKNEVNFIADDGDNNLHLEQAEILTETTSSNLKILNQTKTYFDFFELVQTPEGPRYPDANIAINQNVNNGILIMNYTGHGGADGWGHERVLTIDDIDIWDNFDNLPIIISATGDFGKYDDPEITSLGEYILLKNNGGGAGLITQNRMQYASLNHAMNKNIFEYISDNENETLLGDVLRYAKNTVGNPENTKGWCILGDPALKIPFPEFNIEIESINGTNVTEPLDTIHPGDQITISGKIQDKNGIDINDFNGNITLKVFERPGIRKTLGNQLWSPIVEVGVQDSVLIEQEEVVENGNFDFTFTLPQNLDEEYGNLKLSFYADNGATDASGYFNDLILGGDPSGINDYKNESNLIKVYPTLLTSELIIQVKENIDLLDLSIASVNGQNFYRNRLRNLKQGQKLSVNMSNYPNGIYILNLHSNLVNSAVKVIKQ